MKEQSGRPTYQNSNQRQVCKHEASVRHRTYLNANKLSKDELWCISSDFSHNYACFISKPKS